MFGSKEPKASKPGKSSSKKDNYCPPAPKGGVKIPAPPKNKIKTFTISSGKCPFGMDLPGIEAGAQVIDDSPAASGGGGGGSSKPVNDGFTPEERRKNQLEEDPDFKKYLTMYKMKIPLINIRNKIQGDGTYTTKDIDMFANKEDIEIANSCTF